MKHININYVRNEWNRKKGALMKSKLRMGYLKFRILLPLSIYMTVLFGLVLLLFGNPILNVCNMLIGAMPFLMINSYLLFITIGLTKKQTVLCGTAIALISHVLIGLLV